MGMLSAIGAVAVDKLLDGAIDKMSSSVIQRWSRRRAIAFYRSFIEELFRETPDPEIIARKLDQLHENEATSEMIFEAYRAVSLSKSKTIGPKVIGVLVANIVQRESPVASDVEDLVLAACESLSDSDFLRFALCIDPLIHERVGTNSHPGHFNALDHLELAVDTSVVRTASPFRGGTESINLMDDSLTLRLGLWAERLSALGLITEIRVHTERPNAKTTGFSQLTPAFAKQRVDWRVRFNEGAFVLRNLLRLVEPQAGLEAPTSSPPRPKSPSPTA